MQHRAKTADWMPQRFISNLNKEGSFTNYTPFGFNTKIPILEVGEKIYFHFIVSISPIRQSTEYPEERDISTWNIVNKSKKFLDRKL